MPLCNAPVRSNDLAKLIFFHTMNSMALSCGSDSKKTLMRILENAMDKWEVKCNLKLRPNYFSVNVFVLAVVFRLFEICQRNTIASTETFTEI